MSEQDGFYDFNFKYFAGGVDKRSYRMPSFMPMEIKLSYVFRFSFTPGTTSQGILGMKAVDLIRELPKRTNMVSYHKYICAN